MPFGVSSTAGPAAVIPQVTIVTREYVFDAPDTFSAGITRIHLQNAGQEPHQAQLLKLNDGVTQADIQSAFPIGAETLLALVTAAGGPNVQQAGQSADAIMDLQPGQYVLIDFASGPDGIPHLSKGMFKMVQVTAAASSRIRQLPATQITITMRDFAFDAPATIPAGPTALTVKNVGQQPHEMSVVQVSGVSTDQLKALLTDPSATPPATPVDFTPFGGMGAIAPGAVGVATLNLAPGSYTLIDFLPDPITGEAHAQLGMVAAFSVR